MTKARQSGNLLLCERSRCGQSASAMEVLWQDALWSSTVYRISSRGAGCSLEAIKPPLP